MTINVPTLKDYLAASGVGLHSLQKRFVNALFSELCQAASFKDLNNCVQCFIDKIVDAGYELKLLDEDGESMIIHGGVISDGRSITVQANWDEYEGPSVACTFIDGGVSFTLAKSRTLGPVEIESN